MLASLAARPRLLALALALLILTLAAAPHLRARAQDAAREVSIVNTPTVRLRSIDEEALRALREPRITPSFIRSKTRYAFTWNRGEPAESYVVVSVHDDGWIGVVISDTLQPELYVVTDRREVIWLNVTRAFSIREVIP